MPSAAHSTARERSHMHNASLGGVVGALPLGNICHAAGHGSHADDASVDVVVNHDLCYGTGHDVLTGQVYINNLSPVLRTVRFA